MLFFFFVWNAVYMQALLSLPQLVEKVCFFKKVLVLNPYPQTPFPRKGAECGAAALTKQGRLKSVAHSRCTMQRHQRLTTRIGAMPQTPFLKLCRFCDNLKAELRLCLRLSINPCTAKMQINYLIQN